MRAAAALLLLGAVVGCGPPELTDVQVAAADLVGASTLDVAILGGGAYGHGSFAILAADGSRFRLPVHLNVGLAGTMIDLGLEQTDEMKLDKSHASDVVTAADLMTTYEGFRGALLIGVGVDGWDLESASHLGLSGVGGGLGISMFIGHAWVGIGADGDLEPVDEPAGSDESARQDAGPGE